MGAMDPPGYVAYVFWHRIRADGEVAAHETLEQGDLEDALR
jgi:hypothetical protein